MLSKPTIITLAVILLSVISNNAPAQQCWHQAGMHHAWQGNTQQQAQGVMPHCQLQLDLAGKTSLDGIAESVSMAPGQGMPSFVIRIGDQKATVIASPYWALANANFEIRVGDKMSVLAFPSLQFKDTYVAAELKNLATGKSLILRDEYGMPVGGFGPRRGGPRSF